MAPPLPRAGPRFSFPPHLSLSFGQLCAGALSAGAGLLDTAPCPDSRAAPAVLCFSQTPPRFPEIPAHPSPSKYPLRSSALFPVSLFAFPLFPGFGAFWEGIPCPGLPSVVLLFFPQSLWAGTSSPSQGREGRREAEREGGSSGGRDGGSQESQKAKRAGERGEEGMGKECSGEGGQRALCEEGSLGEIPGRGFPLVLLLITLLQQTAISRGRQGTPHLPRTRGRRGYSRQRDILQKTNSRAQSSQREHRLQQGRCRVGIWWVWRDREA